MTLRYNTKMWTRVQIGDSIRDMDAPRSNRKRPSPNERIEIIVPAPLKAAAAELAAREKLPLRIFVRRALEKEMQEVRAA